jgi:poly-gamma-glutamate capsule biosynthesis protein CapA/YwtB (metallophosphatase superfamily)
MKLLNWLLASFLLLIPMNLNAEEKKVAISAVGDVMLGNRLNSILKQKGYESPFQATVDYFKDADISFCNLEAPLTTSDDIIPKEFNFKADPEAVKSLIYAGIDIVSLANNHAMDYGKKGLEETMKVLEANNIRYVGVWKDERRQAEIIEKNGLKVAWLAYSGVSHPEFESKDFRYGTLPSLIQYIQKDVKEADSLADIVVVSLHCGKEMSKEPIEYQKVRAHAAIDAGADLVIGHHPHVLQPIEHYKNGLIVYSLGNFVFGSYSSIKSSAILQATISNDSGKNKIENINIIPVDIHASQTQQPMPLEGKEKDKIIKFMLGE